MFVQSDYLLSADVFENFQNTCLKIYELDSAQFLSSLELAWPGAWKSTKAKSNLLTDINMLLMVEKGVKSGRCHIIHWYVKANNKYMKNYEKNKDLLYRKYSYLNNFYGHRHKSYL